MPVKRLLRPERLRRVPAQFSWVDQRLVRERYIERCDAPALALYLFLITVSDAQGLSYYGDAALCRNLAMDASRLHEARSALIDAGLVAYEAPLYQVLSLDPPDPPAPARTHSLQAIDSSLARLRARLAARKAAASTERSS